MENLSDKRILVTGAYGFLGSFIVDALRKRGVSEERIIAPTHAELDLVQWENCVKAVEDADVVIHAAARVGGSKLNLERSGESFYENIMMGVQMMEAARQAGVQKFVVIGTFSSYPKDPPNPIREEYFWDGYPEEVNAPYGMAKKAILVQAEAYREQYGFNVIYLIPTNIYGPRDNFEFGSSHVIPALIRRVVEAKVAGDDYITVWGSGKSKREFIYVEDVARGIVLATERYDRPEPVNISTGREISIGEAAGTICRLAGFDGEMRWDTSRPDKRLQCTLDVSRAEQEFGFRAGKSFEEGIKETIAWYREHRPGGESAS